MCNRLTHDAGLDPEFLIQTQRHIGSEISATACWEAPAPPSGTIAACILWENPVQQIPPHK
jgi:hypothetical protein